MTVEEAIAALKTRDWYDRRRMGGPRPTSGPTAPAARARARSRRALSDVTALLIEWRGGDSAAMVRFFGGLSVEETGGSPEDLPRDRDERLEVREELADAGAVAEDDRRAWHMTAACVFLRLCLWGQTGARPLTRR